MAKPDNRKNNVERLQQMRENTIENIEAAEETLAQSDMDGAERQAVEQKNERRRESINAFEAEIKDEKEARERGEY
ncbi:small acid-soluble spore protein Tlp [Alkalihalophilus pseudofirmus]|uniref:small acid-soluble spore protein Tlp n=1 Tax=Alkalihalobacterium alkalinitrilicum TaxID=427920 RepID=UPI00094DE515|nr:small acid-soluble spore protein Tlp [Alkalihalobacterium alkalinitrilicum]OLO40376.1 small acid-soluble spore protein Tlp [Alkalihalophilus pseudofirmus]